jgi:hypothetical protein
VDLLVRLFNHYNKQKRISKQEYETVMQWFEDSEVMPSGPSSFIRKKTKKRHEKGPPIYLHVEVISNYLLKIVKGIVHYAWIFLIYIGTSLKKLYQFIREKFKKHAALKQTKHERLGDTQSNQDEQEISDSQVPYENSSLSTESIGDQLSSDSSAEGTALPNDSINEIVSKTMGLVGERIDQRLSFYETQLELKNLEIKRNNKEHEDFKKKERKKQAILLKQLQGRHKSSDRFRPSIGLFRGIFTLVSLYAIAFFLVATFKFKVPTWFYVPSHLLSSLVKVALHKHF